MIEVVNKIDETLIENIGMELKKRDWNRAELARRLGKEPMVVTRLMNRAVWDSELLLKLSEVLDRSPSELLADHRNVTPPSPAKAAEILTEFVKKHST